MDKRAVPHAGRRLAIVPPGGRCYRPGFIIAATLVAGYLASLVKYGSEHDMPPRPPERIAPPVVVINDSLAWFDWGSIQDYVYVYGGNSVNMLVGLFHHGFSIVFAFIYIMIAEKYPKIRLWHGAFYGIIITILMHYVFIPLWGAGPALWNLPWTEHVSELWGGIIWGFVIEMAYVFMRYYMTGAVDNRQAPRRKRE
ncbi:MAG: DUF1440 domain-containing protein [Candidatus Tokpelaia sp.]|uniref:DUF1440 domain-containing protein n=1 Tax=Candidatus Tokpelaia sp. TaxID=2233777 RepID=UPI0012384027|nr:DUF1440 domain-containing protein [Candidatus Tokpelaia sp.]KAA6205560.1 MAG: DUF1440 domain-containing protein [Candidatus Tokpelaia sp.]KAA6207511.1 MAG: DUF1440 domain-containing protein [Candidatus Tokpelaia sp.]KAA6404681.1 DUF1440 domain-containing protein [Candidatus Tokpelaia sp.]